MKTSAFDSMINSVMVLDIINGRELTARIKAVDHTANTVTILKPRVFVPVPDPNNPAQASVMALRYGHPMYEADEEMTIDTAHVFTTFKPAEDHVRAYEQHTSSIVTAPAGALNGLPAFDANGNFVG